MHLKEIWNLVDLLLLYLRWDAIKWSNLRIYSSLIYVHLQGSVTQFAHSNFFISKKSINVLHKEAVH